MLKEKNECIRGGVEYLCDIDNLYVEFRRLDETPVILTHQEFEKFKPLFKRDTLNNLYDKNTSEFEEYCAKLKELSMELLSRINPYREFRVEQLDGSYVIFPPIYIQTPTINKD